MNKELIIKCLRLSLIIYSILMILHGFYLYKQATNYIGSEVTAYLIAIPILIMAYNGFGLIGAFKLNTIILSIFIYITSYVITILVLLYLHLIIKYNHHEPWLIGALIIHLVNLIYSSSILYLICF